MNPTPTVRQLIIKAMANSGPNDNPPLKSIANAKEIAAHAFSRSLSSILLVDTGPSLIDL